MVTVGDYGVTIDENHGRSNGEYFIRWYASAASDRAIVTEGNHYLYGSFFNALGALAERISPFGAYDTRHFLVAVTGLIGIFFAARLARLIGGPLSGFLAAVMLAATPVYYGHMFMNPKDIPFAVLSLAATYFLLRAYEGFPRLPKRDILVIGIVIGLALGVRIGALMLVGYAAVLAFIWLVVSRFGNHASNDPLARGTAGVVVSLVSILAVAWMVMLPWWPYAQLNPILNPLRAFRRAANFTDFPADVLFGGRFIPSDELPLNYLPKFFSITLPEYYAVAIGAGLIALTWHLATGRRRTWTPADRRRLVGLAFVIFTIVFPLSTVFLLRPILYDGNRHFLFIIPPLAVVGGVALGYALRSFAPTPLKAVAASVVAASVVLTTIDMVRLHPYQYLFYNRSFGGLPTALGRYATDYWGQSHKEGVEWLMRNYRPDAPPGSIRVANSAADFQTAYYIEEAGDAARRFVPVRDDADPDIVLTITRWNVHLRYPGKVLHVVRRVGVPLLYVVDVR